MTQLTKAKNGEITKVMEKAAAKEGVKAEVMRKKIAAGKVVIPANINHQQLDPVAFGEGLKQK